MPADPLVPRPPWWALASAALAPVAMIGGWAVAASLQQEPFDPVRETISALAASTATAPWVMTAGLGVTGACHLVTAAGLRAAAPAGRVLLAVGGLGTCAVAALPVDVAPHPHGVAAGVAFVALSVWPAAARRRGSRGVLGRWSTASAVTLVGLLGWFLVELQRAGPATGDLTGITERLLAGSQSVWPLVVVLALRRRPARPRPKGGAATARTRPAS